MLQVCRKINELLKFVPCPRLSEQIERKWGHSGCFNLLGIDDHVVLLAKKKVYAASMMWENLGNNEDSISIIDSDAFVKGLGNAHCVSCCAPTSASGFSQEFLW
eukprot:3202616-Amphidinium_carterae.1